MFMAQCLDLGCNSQGIHKLCAPANTRHASAFWNPFESLLVLPHNADVLYDTSPYKSIILAILALLFH